MGRATRRVLALMAGLAFVAGAAGLVVSKRASLRSLPPPRVSPVPVDTAVVREGRLEVKEHYLGMVRPLRSAVVSTRLTGYIVELSKYEGDRVERGDLLVRLEARGLEARLASLKAELNSAEADLAAKKAIYDRNQILLRHDAISREAFDLSRSALELARARREQLLQEIASAETDLTYAEMRAPFPGVVTRRYMEPGDLATPGSPIIAIEDPAAGYRVLVKVAQERSSSYSAGSAAFLVNGSMRLAVKVFRVHPAVDETGLVTVEIRTKARPFGLPSGASVGVDLVSSAVQGLVLPLAAISRGAKSMVYAVRNGVAEPVEVRILGRSGGMVAVEAGLVPGEKIVVADPGLLLRLHPGQRVTVAEQ